MEIYKTIYEDVVEPPYLKTTKSDDNNAGHIRKMRGRSAPSNIFA